MRTSVLFSLLAVALVAGTACKGPDDIPTDFDSTSGLARGANVVPVPADTTPRATVAFNSATLAYLYSIVNPPAGTIDSIALYQVAAGTELPKTAVSPATTPATYNPGQATVILCAGAAACLPTSGTGTLVGAATNASVRTSIRGYGTQVVFFTTSAQYLNGAKTAAVGGAMRGTLYATPQ